MRLCWLWRPLGCRATHTTVWVLMLAGLRRKIIPYVPPVSSYGRQFFWTGFPLRSGRWVKCGQLTQGCLIEHVVQEYFPVGIEATLCSFSTINYSQARILMYEAIERTTYCWKWTLCDVIESTFHPLATQSVTDLFKPKGNVAQLTFLSSHKHVKLFFDENI